MARTMQRRADAKAGRLAGLGPILGGALTLGVLLLAIGARDGARQVAPHLWRSAVSLVSLVGQGGGAGTAP
jgi:hypothetical protein